MGKEVDAVILAGGRGSRMGELTDSTQKCLLPFKDKPVLLHILDTISDAFGSANVIIATGYHGEDVKKIVGDQYRNIQIEYTNSPEQLETRRRLLLAKNLLKGPFLLTAGDIIYNPELLTQLATSYEANKVESIIGAISVSSLHKVAPTHALIAVSGGYVTEITYPPTTTWQANQLREMGTAFYDHDLLRIAEQASASITQITELMIDALKNGGKFRAEQYFSQWYHFATPEDLVKS